MDIYRRNGETETFRLIPLQELTENCVTLPIDKIVVRHIIERHSVYNSV